MKFHLKGLDSFRAIAALIVVVGHIELFKYNYSLPNFLDRSFFHFTGARTSVVLFFALSGYLITSLLLQEKQNTGNIKFKEFYIRRILRVWPLYYIIILISLILLQYRPPWQSLILCLTIFPNVAHILHYSWEASPQLWSLGVEEQFYLFWPLIISKSKKILVSVIIVFFVFTFGIPYLSLLIFKITHNAQVLDYSTEIVYDLKFNCMAAGGIMAVLQNQKSKLLLLFTTFKGVGWFFILLPFVLWFIGFHNVSYLDEFYACLFAISIWNISENKSIKTSIDIPILRYLGKISYGIYMYHWIVLTVLFKSNLLFYQQNSLISNITLYASAIGITIIISSASYYLLERRFLKLKDKFKVLT